MPKKVPLKLEGFDPFGALVGLTFTKWEVGHSQCVMEVDEKLLNPHRTLHGGATYTMACDTKLVHKGKRIATLESEIRQGEYLIAKALGTWSIFKEKRD